MGCSNVHVLGINLMLLLFHFDGIIFCPCFLMLLIAIKLLNLNLINSYIMFGYCLVTKKMSEPPIRWSGDTSLRLRSLVLCDLRFERCDC